MPVVPCPLTQTIDFWLGLQQRDIDKEECWSPWSPQTELKQLIKSINCLLLL